ncbi:MAG: hypothetical protein ACYC2U_07665 [Candidatus Amoebophilus sp.]
MEAIYLQINDIGDPGTKGILEIAKELEVTQLYASTINYFELEDTYKYKFNGAGLFYAKCS